MRPGTYFSETSFLSTVLEPILEMNVDLPRRSTKAKWRSAGFVFHGSAVFFFVTICHVLNACTVLKMLAGLPRRARDELLSRF